MNIAEAKEQIKHAMIAYFTKDEFGNYKIPIEKQRPIILMGPPGVGKTAIMEQIASELSVGLVSYSMTHHTRQSALGLPYITEKEFEGYEYQVSNYTMSEIIGAVYDMMRETGVREGILFLDEINCVSETLAPCMLQFLQYKIFGQHQIPKGWIVVTAGNPPEYNKSVRDFDIVTWDRLKRIDVTPDYETWKAYAYKKGVHAVVTTYLSARKKDFYKVENTVDGKHFVTARGWDDLSEMIGLYEENHLKVDEKLISQYIQDPKIAKDFAIYYDLFHKYQSDYKVEKIVAGQADEGIIFRASHAPMDERLALLGLLFDAVTAEVQLVCEKEDILDELLPIVKKIGTALAESSVMGAIEMQVEKLRKKYEQGKKSSSLSIRQQKVCQNLIRIRQENQTALRRDFSGKPEAEQYQVLKENFRSYVAELQKLAEKAGHALNAVFEFCENAFKDGDELLLFVTELTVHYYTARFIGHYGCDKYYLYNKELRFEERQKDILKRVNAIQWDL
ncbi:MAG: AAA family ATPase [Anaerotignum sp.]|nr:AAA family ATPase [Anaerotignum sp.]